MLEQWLLYFMIMTGHAQNISQHSTPTPHAEEVYILAPWTAPNIARHEHLGIDGTFTPCGRYLMRHEVKKDSRTQAMFVFGAIGTNGRVIKFFEHTAEDIHVSPAPQGTKPFAKALGTKTNPKEITGYSIALPPDDYETMLHCLNKKSPEKTPGEK